MDINKQLDEFYSTLDYRPLSSNAIALYTILLQIAKKTNWISEFKVTNTILTSKTRLTVSTLQRARNELIVNEYIGYKKGSNQTDASKYSIIDLTRIEQPNTQPNAQAGEQPSEQASEHIITKLNILFYYLNNRESEKISNDDLEEVQINSSNKNGIINILKRLDIYITNTEILNYMSREQILNYKIQYWVIKEIYNSPHVALLNKITKDKFKFRFLKAKKYIDVNDLEDFTAYFIRCLQNELEGL